MAIEGPIEELSLADLLQLLSLTGKTGSLSITGRGGEETGKVFLKDGNVASAYQKGREGIGERLLKAGRISKERLTMAQNASTGFKPLGEALVELNFITSSELEDFQRVQVEETVYELFELKRGYFRFEEGDIPPDVRPVFSLKVESLLMEGSRRMDEWSRISHTIPSLDLVLELAISPDEPGHLNLRPKDWTILSLVDGKRTVREVVRQIGGELETGRQLYELISAGVLRLNEPSTGETETHAAKGERFLREGHYAKAAAELELALDANPKDPKILSSLGEALYRNGSYREALNLYGRLRDLNPDKPEVHYHLGFCLARLGELGSAICEWQAFLSLAPSQDSRAGIESMIELAKALEGALGRRQADPFAKPADSRSEIISEPILRDSFLFEEKTNE